MGRGFVRRTSSGLERVACGGVLAVLAATACLNDMPTAKGTTTLSATLNANVVGAIAGGTVRIRVGYRTSRQQFIALPSSPEQVAVAAGATVVIPVTVDIGPCLSDPDRVFASERGCLLTIELTLLDPGGSTIDTQTRDASGGPATPGQAVDFGTVTVGITVSIITVAPTSLSMNVGDEQQLVATVRDAAGVVTTAQPVTWNTTDATVTQLTAGTAGSVTVRALKLGTASISATAGGKSSAAVPVNVVPPPPLVIRQRQGAGCVLIGQTINLDVDSPPGPITWTSASNVATVSSAGVVTGVTPGSVVITATSGNRTGTATVCVTAPPRVVQNQLSVIAGQTVQIVTTGATGGTFSYSSGAPTIATVDAAGLVRGVSIGQATITVKFTAASGSDSQPVQVTVIAAGATITPTSGSAGLGNTARFTIIARDANGAAIPGAIAAWTIDDATIGSLSGSSGASVDVRALKLGSTIVRATTGGVTATAQFIATQPLPAARLEKVSGDGATCPTRSTSCTFVVRTVDANGGSVPNVSVSWASNATCGAPKVVASDNTGLASATNICSTVSPGAYAQTATLVSNGQQASFSFTLRGLVLTLQDIDSFGNYIYTVASASGPATGLTAAVSYVSGQVTNYVSLLKLSSTATPATLTVGFDQFSLPIGNYAFDVIVSTTTPGTGPGVDRVTFSVDSGGFVVQQNDRRSQASTAAVRAVRAP